MKKLATAVAIASALSTAALVTPVFADNHMSVGFVEVDSTRDILASNLIGMTVYNADIELNDDLFMDADGIREWDNIGEVEDVVLGRDGKVKAVVLGVGGFLDIGDRSVAVKMDSLKFVNEQGNDGGFFLAVKSTKDELMNAPEFTLNDMTETTVSETYRLEAPDVKRDGYERTVISSIAADRIEGNYVYGAKDETVGEIDALILDNDGKVSKAVINVGGFLGLGEHPVAVSFDELTILKNTDDDVRIYIDSTEEKLEQLPEYVKE